VSNQQLFAFENAPEHFAATPSAVRPQGSDFSQFLECLNSHGNRVVLSGIGGDEVTGGVPSPTPELADLLSRAQLRALFHKLKVWALDKRKPWLHLLFQAARGFFPSALVGVPAHQSPAPWLNAKFVKRNYAALRGYPHRLNLFGPTPSFQTNLSTLEVLQRQFACSSPHPGSSLYETRYPYLDRDLLEFMYAVPRGQIVRPGQRRSLMRRALIGIVPDELLNRKRKAFIARSLHATLSANWPSVVKLIGNMQTAELGIVNSERLAETLQNARLGREVAIVSLTRTFELECWLQQLASRDITPHFVARREMDKGWIANSQINVAHTGYLGRGHSN
jgi:asparagine synthase (glutamine-hydrolysing)